MQYGFYEIAKFSTTYITPDVQNPRPLYCSLFQLLPTIIEILPFTLPFSFEIGEINMALQPMAAALGNRRLSRTSIDRFMGDLVHYVVMGEEKLVDRDYSIFQLFEAYAHVSCVLLNSHFLPVSVPHSCRHTDHLTENRSNPLLAHPAGVFHSSSRLYKVSDRPPSLVIFLR